MSSYDAFYYEKYGKVADFNFMPMNNIFETIKPINPKFLATKNQYGNDEKIFLEKVLSFTEHKKEFTNNEFEVIVMYGECYVEKLVEQLDYIENNIGSNFIKLTISSEINDCRSVLVNKNKVIKVGDNSYNKCATITIEGNIIVDVLEPFEKVIEMIEKSCDKD